MQEGEDLQQPRAAPLLFGVYWVEIVEGLLGTSLKGETQHLAPIGGPPVS